MRDPGTPVVRANVEPVKAKRRHHGDAIGRHDRLAVLFVVFSTGGFGTFAVAAEVEEGDVVGGGEVGGDEVPY